MQSDVLGSPTTSGGNLGPEKYFDAEAAKFHAELKEILHKEYVICIPACAEELRLIATTNGDPDFGATLDLYIAGFVLALRSLVETFGNVFRFCFNSSVWERKITFGVNPLAEHGSAISASVQNGVYCILVHRRWFGTSHCVPSRDQDPNNIFRTIDAAQKTLKVLGGISILDTAYDE